MSYVNRAKDAEAQTNLGAIFTDETAFSATNSIFINAGYNANGGAVTLPSTGTVSAMHPFYGAGANIDVDAAPFTCTGGVLATTTGGTTTTVATPPVVTPYAAVSPALGGFGDLGFYPKGSLYFYYQAGAYTGSSSAAPTTAAISSSTAAGTALVLTGVTDVANGSCGGGFAAIAASNFAGANLQEYAVNDFTSKATLVLGTAY